MAVNFAYYAGREPAFVKHTFLDKYLPALIGRVASHFDDFVYVDGFAGPWRSVAGESFADTSFGIALRHMTELKSFFAERGRTVRMTAYLVEKDPATYAALQSAVRAFPKVNCFPLNGWMEDQVPVMLSRIPKSAFSF